MLLRRFIFLLFLLPVFLKAQVIPHDRITDWSLAGYRDSIPVFPNVVNITSYGGIGDGITPNDIAFQNSLAALNGRSGTIYFPAGNFLFRSSKTLPDSIVLKGNSADSTTLSFNLNGNSDMIRIAGSISTVLATLVAEANRDSTLVQVSDPGQFSAGDYIKISQNDSSLLFSNWAYGTVGQIVQVKTISGNRLVLNSPLRKNFLIADSCKVRKLQPRRHIGLECFKLKRLDQSVGQTNNIDFNYAVKCWMKGVESDTCNFAHVAISNSANIEISGCYFRNAFSFGDGGKAYGITLQYTSGECLIENNIFDHLRHAMLLQAGANGNVFGYNNSTNPFWVSGSLPSAAAGDMVLHGNYPFMNLFEGNTGQNMIIDDSHGINGPFNTFFRNRGDLYGIFMNNNPASNEQNLVGNEIPNAGFLLGFYLISGTGQFEYANNVRGSLMPAGTTPLPEASYYKTSRPGFFDAGITWPGIGIPNVIGTGTTPAQQRKLQGQGYCDCRINYPFIHPDQYTDISGSVCKDSAYLFHGNAVTQQGIYQDTIHTGNGYDSIITLHLSVLLPDTSNISDTICAGDSYDFDGQQLDTAGVYAMHLSNLDGCDSMIILTLSVIAIDTTVSVNSTTLTANEQAASYQWFDCDINPPLSGADSQSFTGAVGGRYRVEITRYNCSASSACISLVSSALVEPVQNCISVEMNPDQKICRIYFNCSTIAQWTLVDLNGKILMQAKPDAVMKHEFSYSSLPAGVYILKCNDGKHKELLQKLVCY